MRVIQTVQSELTANGDGIEETVSSSGGNPFQVQQDEAHDDETLSQLETYLRPPLRCIEYIKG